jgi:hypothetical protein
VMDRVSHPSVLYSGKHGEEREGNTSDTYESTNTSHTNRLARAGAVPEEQAGSAQSMGVVDGQPGAREG